MNPLLEFQLFTKAKKLIRRRIRNFTAFQNFLLNEEFIEAISTIDDLEESFEDILIFDVSTNFRNYEESLSNEMRDLEDLKNDVVVDMEMRICDCRELTDEESLEMLEEMVEK